MRTESTMLGWFLSMVIKGRNNVVRREDEVVGNFIEEGGNVRKEEGITS